MVICTSFSASAKVAADTGGPVTGPVPKAGGAPGVGGVDMVVVDAGTGEDGAWPRHSAVAVSMPMGAVIRNCRRLFMAVAARYITVG